MPKPRLRSNPNAVHPILRRMVQPLGRLLQGPYGVAAIASIGFHGVVFALGPALSDVSIAAFGDGDGGNGGEQTVPLVELSAAEQGRLPDFSNRRLAGRVPLPNSTPPSLPLQRTPQRSTFGNLPQRSAGLRRSTPSILDRQRTAPSSRVSRNTPFVWSGRTGVLQPPPITDIPTPSETEQPPQADSEPAASTTTTGPDTAAENPTPDQDTNAEANGTDLSLSSLEDPQGTGANGEATGEVPSPEGEQTPDTSASNEADPEQVRLQELRNSLQWDEDGTDAGEEEVDSWLASLQAVDETIIAAEVDPEIDVEANIRVCVENPPTNAIVGVLVQPDGTIADATLVKRTGYDTTDQAALNAAEAAAAEAAAAPAETPVAYQININIDHDAESCIAPGSVLE